MKEFKLTGGETRFFAAFMLGYFRDLAMSFRVVTLIMAYLAADWLTRCRDAVSSREIMTLLIYDFFPLESSSEIIDYNGSWSKAQFSILHNSSWEKMPILSR